MSKSVEVTTPSDREIRVERMFDAPRSLVWDCHTRPELMMRWLFGPGGWRMTACEMDLRIGGAYRWVWRHDARGLDMTASGAHQEVAAPGRLIATQAFDDNWIRGGAVNVLELFEAGGGTRLVSTTRYVDRAARDAMLQTGMTGGMAESYDRLEAVMADAVA